MIIFNNLIDFLPNYSFKPKYTLTDIIFFDIETTGFSADISSVYLIGCSYFSNDQWNLIQWFADDYSSEVLLIKSFFDFISNYKILIHYNGTGFDLPYIKKKCIQHKLGYNFNQIESLDIYKKIKSYKKLFSLPNLKQKSIEEYLSISRIDQYHGGELIDVYCDYMKSKIMKDKNKDYLLSKLLLHNTDDIKGLMQIVPILSIIDFFQHPLPIEKVVMNHNCLSLKFIATNPIPRKFSWTNHHIMLNGCDSLFTLYIPIIKEELKYFFSNYKDYFFLPTEDTAIHKSVAAYVDKEYRTKAKASNCYIKKTGVFVPQFSNTITPFFKKNYSDKISYIECSDELIKNNLALYITDIIHNLC
jgi:uncharacterized protein